MKKYQSYFILTFFLFAATYIILNNFKIYSYILGIILITTIAILIRNISISEKTFKYRFFWYYPLLIFIAMIFYKLMRILIKNDIFREFDYYLIGGITLIIGLTWGIREKYKLKNTIQNNKLSEFVDLLTEDIDSLDKKGILTLTENNELIFTSKNDFSLTINPNEIQIGKIKSIATIFPICLEIELKSGKKYLFNSEFPLTWKKALQL